MLLLPKLLLLIRNDGDGLLQDAAELVHAGLDTSLRARDWNRAVGGLKLLVPSVYRDAVVRLQPLVGLSSCADDHTKLGVVEWDAEVPLSLLLGSYIRRAPCCNRHRRGAVDVWFGCNHPALARRTITDLLPSTPHKLGMSIIPTAELTMMDNHGAKAEFASLLQRPTKVAIATADDNELLPRHHREAATALLDRSPLLLKVLVHPPHHLDVDVARLGICIDRGDTSVVQCGECGLSRVEATVLGSVRNEHGPPHAELRGCAGRKSNLLSNTTDEAIVQPLWVIDDV